MNGWTPEDFAPGQSGPQFQWLSDRLALHGHPLTNERTTVRQQTQAWQLANGYRGTELGQAADGYVGSVQLRQLKAAPSKPQPLPGTADVPSEILDFRRFKLTRPDGKEIGPDQLTAGYEDIACFFATADGDGVVFLVDIDGRINATTPNTKYSRTECRELEADGSLSGWSSRNGLFIMRGELQVTELPEGDNGGLVFAQAHDDLDDIIMAQCRGSELFISQSKGKGKGSIEHPLIDNYKLGGTVEYEMVFSPTGIDAKINGKKIDTIKKVVDDAYWKFGCYAQANKKNGSGHAEVVYTGHEIERR